MTRMECGGSPAPILSGTPLLQFQPNRAPNNGHKSPLAFVVAQHAAPVCSFLAVDFQLSTID
jgi:hypothetical protein